MLLDQHIEETALSAIPVTVFIGLSSILGTFGNVVVIVVYSRKYPKCNFKYFVLVLAGLDLVSCVVLMPLEIYTLLHWFVFKHAWLCKSKSFLNVFTVTSSASALLLIAIDRFRKVCKPHGTQILPRRAIQLSILVLALSLIPATSDAVFWGIHSFEKEHEGYNKTLRMCEKDDKFKNTIWPKLHVTVLYAGGNSVVMLATTVLYICIGAKMFCVPSGPEIVSPQIKVQMEDSGIANSENGNKETGNMFRFPADNGVESGLSDSEDLDKFSSIDLSDSQEGTMDNTLDETEESNQVFAENKEATEASELVVLRKKKEITKEEKEAKVLRISLEGICSEPVRNSWQLSDKTNSLQVPDTGFRRPPRSPKSPRSPRSPDSMSRHVKNHKSNFHKRRSTLASLTGSSGIRLRRKTLIMFILTAVFIITSVLYFCLIGLMSDADDFLLRLSHTEQAVWLFFLRLYFINSVINPILYGFLDPRFRKSLWNMGVHIGFLAGSIKRSIGNSLRGGNSSNDANAVNSYVNQRPRLKSRSSASYSA